MTIPEILKELEPYTGQFPLEAMRAAIEQREAITPELLRVVEAVAEEPLKYAPRQDYMLHLFALYLLAQFRERRAYAPIVKMVSAPGETADALLGETAAAGLSQILASVYDGNPAPLRALVENETVDEFVRSSALDTFVALVRTDQMPRAEVIEYFRSLFQGKLERTNSFVWDGLVCAVGNLPAPELLEEVRWAYAEKLADDGVASLEEIERDVAAPDPSRHDRRHLITDAIAEMEWWAAFQPEDSTPPCELEAPPPPPVTPAPPPTSYVPPKPFVREEPKVGRNDPCPCGSGKKYKKCCGK
jgi:hypothetical protein